MLSGLHNGPVTSQRFIDEAFGVDIEDYPFVHLDDAVICTTFFEKHVNVLQGDLKRLRQASVILNKGK